MLYCFYNLSMLVHLIFHEKRLLRLWGRKEVSITRRRACYDRHVSVYSYSHAKSDFWVKHSKTKTKLRFGVRSKKRQELCVFLVRCLCYIPFTRNENVFNIQHMILYSAFRISFYLFFSLFLFLARYLSFFSTFLRNYWK